MADASIKKTTPRSKPGERLYRVGRAKTGLGLYAIVPIPDRKLVIEYSGTRIPTKRAREIDRARANKYLFEIDGGFNRSLQHIRRISQPASDRARSFSAFHSTALRWH